MKPAAAGVLALLVLALTGCGSDGPGLSDAASQSLDAQVQLVRSAAQAGDHQGAADALDALRGSVSELLDAGEINELRADAVLEAADRVEAELDALPTTTTTTTTTAPPAAPPEDGHDNGRGRGGKGED